MCALDAGFVYSMTSLYSRWSLVKHPYIVKVRFRLTPRPDEAYERGTCSRRR